MGAPALTSRGFVESDFTHVAKLVARGVELAGELSKEHGPKLKDFKAGVTEAAPSGVLELREEVEEFAKQFPTIGFEKATMRYQE